MRGIASLVIGGLIALSFFVASAFAAPAGKIDICHVPPGNPANAQTISISINAWENGHSPHNTHALDYEGRCNVPEPTRTPIPTGKPTTEPSSTPDATRTPRATPTFDFNATAIPVCRAETVCDLCLTLEELNSNLDRIADALEAANE